MTRISLGQNLSSLSAQRGLANASVQLSQTHQRLSSGLRINRASDDAAGLAISSALSVSARVLGRGIQNINDGISLLSIADGVIANLSDILIRLKELAEQAASGTYSAVQRKALDKEAQTLRKEYQRLVQSTTFNNVNLLNGTLGSVHLQAGFGENGGIVSTLGGAIGTGSFSQLSGYSGSYYQTKAAVGDLNQDGIPDEIVGSGGRLQVLLGNGDGSFRTAASCMGGGSGVADVRLADLNNDGLLDAVSADAQYVLVLLGRGDGSFSAQKSYVGAGAAAGDVMTGDLNNDGNLDVLRTFGASGDVQMFLGAGDGTLSAGATFATSLSNSNGSALADLNGDGNVDLVQSGTDGTNSAVAVWLGNGNGTFKSAVSSVSESAGLTYYKVSAGDVNNDGNIDLVTNDDANNMIALLGTGNGFFEIQAGFDAGIISDGSVASILGDLNGDGFTDLVVHDRTYVSAMLGNGKGAFTPNQIFDASLASEFNDMALADIDSDGVLDLVTAGYSSFTEVKNYKGAAISGTAPLLDFSLTSKAGALQAMGMLSAKLNQLSSQRGTIGAFQSRLSSVLNVTECTQTEYLGAESRIKDADIAAEAANLVKAGIVQQAAAAILGQANQQSGIALKLLGM